MDIPNFVKKINSGSLKDVKEDFHVLSDIENEYLYNIFKCKSDIARCLADLLSADECEGEWTEKLKQSRENLIQNLNMKSDELLDKFILNYCLSRLSVGQLRETLNRYSTDRINEIEDESLMDHYRDVNIDLSRMVFHRVGHEDILEFMKNVKHIDIALNSLIYDYINKDLLPHVSKALDLHIENLNKGGDLLKNILIDKFGEKQMDQVEQFLTKTIFDLRNDTLKIVEDRINQKIYEGLGKDINVSFGDFVALVAVASIDAVDFEYFTNLFDILVIKYLSEDVQSSSVESTEKSGHLEKVSVDNKFEFEDFEKFTLLSKNISEKMGYHGELNDLDIQLVLGKANRMMDLWRRELLNIVDEDECRYLVNHVTCSDDQSEHDDYFNSLYAKYSSQFYDLLKKGLIRRAKDYFRKNLSNVDLTKQEKENLKRNMELQYPDASKKTGWYIISSSKWKALKQDFLDANIDSVVSNFSDILAQYETEIMNSTGTDILTLFGILLSIIPDIDLNMKDKLIDFSNSRLREVFEKDKGKRDMMNSLEQQRQQKILEKKVEEEKIEDIVIEKNLLPIGMNEDLVSYFGHDIDQRLDRYLRNSGGVYKSDWFDKYDVNEQFFEILDKYGFVCIDEEDFDDDIVEKGGDEDDIDISGEEKVDESAEIIELKNILDEIETVESVEQKVDLFISAFKLFYDIYEEQNFREKLFEYCRDNREVLNGVWSTLDMLSKGKKEKVETTKSREGKYYKFNIGRTGYRLVLQNQKGSSRRIIIDFADHDTYEGRCDYYYNFVN